MRLSHMCPVTAARFDDPNLVSSAGLIPVNGTSVNKKVKIIQYCF